MKGKASYDNGREAALKDNCLALLSELLTSADVVYLECKITDTCASIIEFVNPLLVNFRLRLVLDFPPPRDPE